MRLEKASYKALKYACLKFHYAKRVPVNCFGYSVFNKQNDWCGVVVFGAGIMGIERPFNQPKGTVYELVRMALNGKQHKTSQVLGAAIRLFKKDMPLVKILVSYADTDQGHEGTIYKATNWILMQSKKTCPKWKNREGKEIHDRRVSTKGYKLEFGKKIKCYKPSELTRIETGVKHKYIYPLRKDVFKLCGLLKKQAQEAKGDEALTSSKEKGGASPTSALNLQRVTTKK